MIRYFHQLINFILEIRTFFLFWGGQSLSEIGNRLTGFGLSIWVYQHTHAVTQLSVVIFLTTLPGVLITPVVGALVDRWNRQVIIIISDMVAAIVTLTLAILLFTNYLEVWHTYISAFITSLCGSFQMIAKSAAVTMMVKNDQIGRANGLIQLSTAVGQLTAPILAGILIGAIELQGLLVLDFSSYIIALIILSIIKIPEPESSDNNLSQRLTVFQEIAYGWASISGHFVLVILLVFMTLHFFISGMTTVLIDPLILSFASTITFGTVMSIAGCGMVVGSVFMSIWGGGKKSILTLFVFSALNGVALIIAGFKPFIPTIAVGLFISFFTIPIVLSTNYTIWQTSVHPKVQGRVLSLLGAVTGLGLACGNLSASPLADGMLEPMLSNGGLLASTVGQIIEIGQGRGIGLLMILEGLLMLITAMLLYNYFYFRQSDQKWSMPKMDEQWLNTTATTIANTIEESDKITNS
ncbi:MFS transporter [Anabaena sp. FACHB-1237]|uniref:MFS transporter n=1 Tax=Anabaena sp. FACHB-1237 TaxID=2692769 RepID=UPI00168152D4|nr:MFS transporter [Anabaena sp. FACHB-1237]MBD2136142.1 MFS transporter [Anabaena sp. FACHB-1237]